MTKKKPTSLQKNLMIGITSSLMFYIIAELAWLTEKFQDCIDRRILFIIKICIAVWIRYWMMGRIRNKFYD